MADHFYTTSPVERDAAINSSGYTSEGTACFVHGDSDERDRAIEFFGYHTEGIACFVFGAARADTVPLFRLVNPASGDHFYTQSAAERDAAVANHGYRQEGVACHVHAAQVPGAVPLFRLVNASDHFYTTSAAERDNAVATFGYQSEGTACFVYETAIAGTAPFYRLLGNNGDHFYLLARGTVPYFRLFSPATGDHFYTTSPEERDNAVVSFGYQQEGVACYVYDTQSAGTSPLFRLVNPESGDHFYTTSAAERDNAVTTFGYQNEGVACFVFDTAVATTVPLFRLLQTGQTVTVIIRKDIWTLRAGAGAGAPWDPVTEAYARAVRTMQSRPASDPTSWRFQAAIHGAYAAPPAGARWNECQHANWYFLPWHRMYLFFFERIVRAAVLANGGPSDFALPYWNYDKPAPGNTLPEPFRVPTLPDGSANPLFLPSPRRNNAIMNGAQLSPLVTSPSAAMALRVFAGTVPIGFGGGNTAPAHFGGSTGAVEQTPHNVIHVQVGGNPAGQCQGGFMIDPNCAALDPIFWLHHANIDRLWNRWLALGGGRANPTAASWLNQSFPFYDESGTLVTMTGSQVVDAATQLGYLYDDDTVTADEEGFIMSSAAPDDAEPSGPPEMVAATEQPVVLAGGRVSIALTVPPSTRDRVTSEAVGRAAGGPETKVYLNVEDIEAPRNPGVVYGVFLNPPAGAGDAERARYHVGNITLFGIESVNNPDQLHDSVPGFRHTFDITSAVAALSAAGNWNPDAINVTFEPILPVAPPGVTDTEMSAPELAHAAATPIRVGRISLFVS